MAFLGTPAQQAFWLATFAVGAIGLAFGDRSVRFGVGLVLGNFILSSLFDHWVWHTVRAAVAVVARAQFGLGLVMWLAHPPGG
ncbi:MAG: hypothetical protein K0M78_03950, partial [Brevundimonas sp.]|nr:hypothetical protein [Brevundimonas sp.]